MTTCANCNNPFKKKPGETGYYRFSIEKSLPGSGREARDELEKMTGQPITPVSKPAHGYFLCSICWNLLNTTAKYKKSCQEFLTKTASPSYLGQKRLSSRSVTSDTVHSPGTSFKGPRFTSTPLQTKTKVARSIFNPGKRGSGKTSKWEAIITAIRARQYRRAMLGMYKATNATKRHFHSLAMQLVRTEIKQLISRKNDFPLGKDIDTLSLQDFSWNDTLAMATETAPLLMSVLKGAVTTRQNQETLVRGTHIQLKPKLGTSLALLLHTRSPHTFKFLQSIVSVQFWRGNLKRQTIDQLAHLGFCIGSDATLSAIDRIRAGFDDTAFILKHNMQQALETPSRHPRQENAELSFALSTDIPNIDDELAGLSDENGSGHRKSDSDSDKEDNDSTSSANDSLSELNDTSTSDEEADEETAPGNIAEFQETEEAPVSESTGKSVESQPPGFTFCWDNVGKKVVTRRPSETVRNTYINMALGYIAVNRVQSTHLYNKTEECVEAASIPVKSFVPNNADFHELSTRIGIIAGRILVRHMPWFKTYFSSCSINHIIHDNILESTYKSVIINLGVFKEEPSSTQGAIGIYSKLQQYVPIVDNKPYTTVVYGDGLSCERGNDALRARSNGLDPLERLEGLEPAAQEFHKEMILLQDFYDDFFSTKSVADRGTLCQVKNMFNYRHVKQDISDNFSQAWELMCVMTESFLCLLATEIFQINEDSGRPADAPEDIEHSSDEVKSRYFEDLCGKIVNKITHKLDTSQLINDDGTALQVLCCGEENDDIVIGCASKNRCLNGEFFHLSCMNIECNSIPDPWFCSDDCKAQPASQYQYCTCKTDLGENVPMIGCSAEDNCTKDEWYHMQCIGINPDKPIKGNWFCSPECKRRRKRKSGRQSTEVTEDHKTVYSLALLWRGLNLMCRRDAVREADGDAMMSHWKFDLVHFFARKHPKYVILAHRLMAAINGWVSPRLRHDIIYNRTVNYGGGIGRNLPQDFMNEILNRLFKDMLSSAKGRYTDTTIDRCSQMIGPFGEALDKVFDSNVVENEIYRHRRRDMKRDDNVYRLFEFLRDERLFKPTPMRAHGAFPNFHFTETPNHPGKFAGKMNELSKRLDKRRKITINA